MCGNRKKFLREICRVIKKFLFSLLFAGALFSTAQNASFQVFAVSGGPIVTYNLRNSGTVDAKVALVSIRFFHQRPNMDFTPVFSIPGFAKYQYQGNFSGKSKSYKYKSVCFFPADSILQPSAQLSFAIGTNYNTAFGDSVLAASISVFCKVDGRDTVIEAFPGGISPCPGKHLFLNGGTPTGGLKEGSFSYVNLAKNACTGSLNMVVYDNASLQRKPVAGYTPLCSGGRKWRSFGFATDSFVYYSFNITNPSGRRGFDSVVQGMAPGDYAMLGNQTVQPLSWFDSCKSTLQMLGFGNGILGSTPGYMVMVGKKGLSMGKAKFNLCASSDLNCYTNLEQTIVAGLSAAEFPDFASCFEGYEVTTEKGWPLKAQKLGQNTILVKPNPTADTWHISAAAPVKQLQLFDVAGRMLHCNLSTTENGAVVKAEGLLPGQYLCRVQLLNGGTHTLRLVKQ